MSDEYKYTYVCQACGHKCYSNRHISAELLEADKIIHDDKKCGGAYRRLYSPPRINIIGTGKDGLDRRAK